MCGEGESRVVVRVEGGEMTVCKECQRFGTVIRQVHTPKPKKIKEPEEFMVATRQDLPDLLREHRERLGLTQEKLAGKIGLKTSTYHYFESGAKKPDEQSLQKLERELKRPLQIHVKVNKQRMDAEDTGPVTIADLIKKK